MATGERPRAARWWLLVAAVAGLVALLWPRAAPERPPVRATHKREQVDRFDGPPLYAPPGTRAQPPPAPPPPAPATESHQREDAGPDDVGERAEQRSRFRAGLAMNAEVMEKHVERYCELSRQLAQRRPIFRPPRGTHDAAIYLASIGSAVPKGSSIYPLLSSAA